VEYLIQVCVAKTTGSHGHIVGGMDQLPKAFLQYFNNNKNNNSNNVRIVFNAKVKKISQQKSRGFILTNNIRS